MRELAEIAQVGFDVPGIVLLPLSEFEQRFAELPRDRDLVLVCQVGERSLKATYFLMYQGYTRVANMEGGLLKWVRKGFPIKGAQPAPAASATTGGCCGAPAPAEAATTCCGSSAVAKTQSSTGRDCCSPTPGSSGSCC